MPEDLQIVMNQKDILKKDEFAKSFKQVLEVVLRKEQKLEKAVAELQQTYNALIDRISKEHEVSLKDLKMKVDGLFVGEQFNKMKSEMMMKMKEIDKRMKMVRNGRDADEGRVAMSVKEMVKPDLHILKETTNMMEAMMCQCKEYEEKFKKLDEKLETLKTQAKGQRVVAGPSADSVQSYHFTQDGSRSYTVPRHRKALMLIRTEAPFMLTLNNGFTTSNTTLTIDPAATDTSGQECIFLYIK